MLTASVLMVLFEPLGHDCDPRYLKPTILAFFGTSRLAQNGHFGLLDKMAKIFRFRFSIFMMSGTRLDVKNKLEAVGKCVLYQKNQQNLHFLIGFWSMVTKKSGTEG